MPIKFLKFLVSSPCAANERMDVFQSLRSCHRRGLSQPPLGVLNELEEIVDFRGKWQFVLNPRNGSRSVQAVAEEDFMGLAEDVLSLGGKAVPFQADFVDRAGSGGIPVRNHKRGNISDDFRAAAGHRMFPYPAELVNSGQASDHGEVFHNDVTSQCGGVGQDDLVAQSDVVGDVAIGQKEIVRTDGGCFSVAGRAVDGHGFADDVSISDASASEAAFPFAVLRAEADAAEGKELVVVADDGVAVHNDVGKQTATVAQNHVFSNNAVRADLAVFADAGAFVNDCAGMNHGGGSIVLKRPLA